MRKGARLIYAAESSPPHLQWIYEIGKRVGRHRLVERWPDLVNRTVASNHRASIALQFLDPCFISPVQGLGPGRIRARLLIGGLADHRPNAGVRERRNEARYRIGVVQGVGI